MAAILHWKPLKPRAHPRVGNLVGARNEGRAPMRRSRQLIAPLLIALFAGTVTAHAQLPEGEVPGSSPAGKMEQMDRSRVPKDPARHPTPQTPDPNFPKPEPVAPRKNPESPPPLPGSGRQEPVPAS